MVIAQSMQQSLNKQINAELYSAYLYLSMAAYYDAANLKGFAHWNKLQYKEETGHAMKLYSYIFDRGGRVTLEAIAAPKTEWRTPLEAFTEAYTHEQKVSAMIHSLVDQARTEKDLATESFLKWFIDEQVEEEDHARSIVERLTLAKDNVGALMIIDGELGRRE